MPAHPVPSRPRPLPGHRDDTEDRSASQEGGYSGHEPQQGVLEVPEPRRCSIGAETQSRTEERHQGPPRPDEQNAHAGGGQASGWASRHGDRRRHGLDAALRCLDSRWWRRRVRRSWWCRSRWWRNRCRHRRVRCGVLLAPPLHGLGLVELLHLEHVAGSVRHGHPPYCADFLLRSYPRRADRTRRPPPCTPERPHAVHGACVVPMDRGELSERCPSPAPHLVSGSPRNEQRERVSVLTRMSSFHMRSHSV